MILHTKHSIKNGNLKQSGIEPPDNWKDLQQVRRVTKELAGKECSKIINNGITVDGKNYSLNDHDQTELLGQMSAIQQGAAGVPYHADGELCRIYPAAEFIVVANAAMAHIFYHRTYCNHLNAWIKRATLKQLNEISYGVQLPDDLAESMSIILNAGGSA